MSMETNMSELDELFNVKGDEAEQEKDEDAVPKFPESSEIPQDLQGKPMTQENVLKLAKMSQNAVAEMTKAKQDLAELAKKVETEPESGSKSPNPQGVSPEIESTMKSLIEIKLDKATSSDKFAAKWKDEIAKTLEAVPLAERMKPETIESAIAYVKGRHIDDILNDAESAKNAPSPSIDTSSVGSPALEGSASKASSIGEELWKNMSESEKSSLLAWADGDAEKLKRLLQGGR